jgi:transcriptional regulator with XRE-family HTH domain
MSRFERPTKTFAPTGSFGRLLAEARRSQKKSIAQMAVESRLSETFIHNLEIGRRSIALNKVPDLAHSYQVDIAVSCWAWITTHAPAVVPYLVAPDRMPMFDLFMASEARKYWESWSHTHAIPTVDEPSVKPERSTPIGPRVGDAPEGAQALPERLNEVHKNDARSNRATDDRS